MNTAPPFRPTVATRRVLTRATELAAGDWVKVEHLAEALLALHPEAIGPRASLLALLGGQRRINAKLDMNIAIVRSLTAAITANTQEEHTLVASIDDLTNIVTQIAADDSALKTSVDAVTKALADAKLGGFTPAQQAALDAAVSELQTVHTDLQADAQEAADAVNPPPAPAP